VAGAIASAAAAVFLVAACLSPQEANTVKRVQNLNGTEPTTIQAATARAVEALLIPDLAAAALAGISRAHWHRLRAAGKR